MFTLALVALLAGLAPAVSKASPGHAFATEHGPLPAVVEAGTQGSEHAHGASEAHCTGTSGHCLIALAIPAFPHHDFEIGFSTRSAVPNHETREGIDLNRDPPPPRS